ncbi:MAG: hypothetical protein R3C11_02660 [Planctomycetaceae bacterium]
MELFRRNFLIVLPLTLFTVGSLLIPSVEADPKADDTKQELTELTPIQLGQTRNVHQFGPTILCGQPDQADFKSAQEKGVEVVITLRTEEELFWNEKELVEDLGLEFHQLGFQQPASLTDQILDQTRELLRNSRKKPVMLHCASANRVGAVWAAHRVLDDGLDLNTALKEAQKVGLRNPGYVMQVENYIKRKQSDRQATTTGE